MRTTRPVSGVPRTSIEIGTLALHGIADGTHAAVLAAFQAELMRLAGAATFPHGAATIERLKIGPVSPGTTPEATGGAIAAAVLRALTVPGETR